MISEDEYLVETWSEFSSEFSRFIVTIIKEVFESHNLIRKDT